MNPSIKKAQELMKLGSLQMQKGEGIESLNRYIDEAYQVTGDSSLLDLSPPENATGIGQKAYVAYEKQAIISVIHSLNTFLESPRNLAKAGRDISEMQKERDRKRQEKEEWEAEQKEREEAAKKEKVEEPKKEEKKPEKEEVEKKAEKVEELTKEGVQQEADSKLLVQFTPTIDETDETKQASEVTKQFRELVAKTGYIKYDEADIEKLKKASLMPKEYTSAEGQNVLNFATGIFAREGNVAPFAQAVQNFNAKGKLGKFLESTALNATVLQAANPTLAENLRLANREPEVKITPTTIQNISSSTDQIVIDALSPVFGKVKETLGKEGEQVVRSFVSKSLNNKTMKKAALVLAEKGIGLGIKELTSDLIASLGAAAGPLAPIVIPILKAIAWVIIEVIGKVVGWAFRKIKKFIDENKEAIVGIGAFFMVTGAITGNAVLLGVGGFMIFAPLLSGGIALVGAGAAGAAAFTIAFIASVAPLGLIAVWIFLAVIVLVLLTIITLFIINSGGFVLPALYETGPGFFPPDCIGTPPPIPEAGEVRFSSNGDYAFPVGQFQVPGYSCYHWDGNKAADIFSPTQRPPIVAAESGKIGFVVMNDSLGGKYIKLEGESGRWYYYAHLCHVFIKSGQSVSAGQVIATMDETGSGRVQHLHYAINENSSYFEGGDGDICPQQDFEEKFNFGVCSGGLFGNKWCVK